MTKDEETHKAINLREEGRLLFDSGSKVTARQLVTRSIELLSKWEVRDELVESFIARAKMRECIKEKIGDYRKAYRNTLGGECHWNAQAECAAELAGLYTVDGQYTRASEWYDIASEALKGKDSEKNSGVKILRNKLKKVNMFIQSQLN